jgi:dTDP-glucose 4,6-dehydratase
VKTFVIDIDGTICTNTDGAYHSAAPFKEIIDKINGLRSDGHKIVYFTARGSKTGLDWRPLTEQQLATWGAEYDELILGKPFGDYYIDDKGVTIKDFLISF